MTIPSRHASEQEGMYLSQRKKERKWSAGNRLFPARISESREDTMKMLAGKVEFLLFRGDCAGLPSALMQRPSGPSHINLQPSIPSASSPVSSLEEAVETPVYICFFRFSAKVPSGLQYRNTSSSLPPSYSCGKDCSSFRPAELQ